MRGQELFGLAPAGHCIAIGTALGAGIVGADVAGFGAQAPRAVALHAGLDLSAGQIRQPARIDTARRRRAFDQKPGLAADGQPHIVGNCDLRKLAGQRPFFLVFRIAPGKPMFARRKVQVAGGFGIDLGEGDRDLVDIPFQHCRQTRKIFAMPGRWCQAGFDDRIIAPDDGTRPEHLRQRPDLRNRGFGIDNPGFQGARISGHRELNHEGRDRRDLAKPALQGPDIAGPEHETVHVARRQRHNVGLAAVWICDPRLARGKPPHKPVAVKCGYIGAIACGNDHDGNHNPKHPPPTTCEALSKKQVRIALAGMRSLTYIALRLASIVDAPMYEIINPRGGPGRCWIFRVVGAR